MKVYKRPFCATRNWIKWGYRDYYKRVENETRRIKQDEELVECLTEKRTKGRVYRLTDLGKKIVEQMKK